ncbi:MAG: hypothetical protein R3272_09190 [Candidatus Promineifilaceae bacterium]|nr:hypothetical protein [Candidatus Promineifilaceae bacterium]
MSRTRTLGFVVAPLFALLLLAGIVGVAQIGRAAPADSGASLQVAPPAQAAPTAHEAQVYEVDLDPLNNSGVDGTAMLTVMGNQLTVTINATGFEAGELHPQHIHGFTETLQMATCPPPTADENDDGLVDLGEGAPFYGPVLLPLEPFPTAPGGDVNFSESYTFSDDLMPLESNAIVLHGMTVDGSYEATLPIACGQIVAQEPVQNFTVDLDPLNNSGVDGMAYLTLDGDELTVNLHAIGVEAGQLHPQHIHGFTETLQTATCPSPAADNNDDGLVDLGEGAPFYGPVLLPLEPFPSPGDSSIQFQETYTLSLEMMQDLMPLDSNAIVLHGMTVDGSYNATLPIACGQIMPAPRLSFVTALDELNDSNASGFAVVTLEGNKMTVDIEAEGVEAGELHPQHIHGFAMTGEEATCPPPTADDNDDGLVDLGEGAPFYGGVLVPLQPYPTPDNTSVDFRETYVVDPASVLPLESRAIVLHGMTVDGSYEATLPIACGALQEQAVENFVVDLDPLNDSGVEGMAYLTLSGDELTVNLHATGVEAGQLHPQHIHGFAETMQTATCPSPAADENDDGLVDLGEGAPFYGPVLQPLEPFPTPGDTTIDFHESYTVSLETLMPLDSNAIVLHGMTVDGTYQATLPIACGQIMAAPEIVVESDLDELNNSGVNGEATITLQGNLLTVDIEATGVEAGMLHPQHVHGFPMSSAEATCPPPTADENDDGLVDLGEGAPFYGPVLLPLEPFPTPDDQSINFHESYVVDPGDLLPLQSRTIVLHGLTVDADYQATLPIACGNLTERFRIYLPIIFRSAS